MLRGFSNDLRLAARRLTAAPLFTLFAVLSLAVGIGVTTIAYSVVDGVFFAQARLPDAARLAVVITPDSGRVPLRSMLSRSDAEAVLRAGTSFDPLAVTTGLRTSFSAPGRTELILAEGVSGDYFDVMGVAPVAGRAIQPADDERGAFVAVLSHDVWRSRFGSDPGVLGHAVRIGGRPFEVVGIAPDSFAGLAVTPAAPGPTVWIPLRTSRSLNAGLAAATATAPAGQPQLRVFGRLHPGRSIEQASAEIGRIAAGLDVIDPKADTGPNTGRTRPREWTARTVADAHAEVGNPIRRFGFVVAGLIVMVLVVACTNLANLVLARGTTRQRDLAVRRALGGSRWRLIREQLAESLIIAAGGGLAAYGVMRVMATWSARELTIFAGQSLSIRPAVDAPALMIAAAALLVSLVVFGLEPAIQLTQSSDVRAQLAAGAGAVGLPKARRHRMLLRWQVAVSTAFFIIAAMTIRFVFTEMRHDSGVRIDGLAVAQLDFGTREWDEGRARRVLERVLEEAGRDRSIESAAVSTGLPFGTANPSVRLSPPDRPIVPNRTYLDGRLIAATPDIFRTIGVPILRGRAFDARDRAGTPPVVVVNEFAARRLFRTADVVGRQMFMEVQRRGPARPAELVTIIGVTPDTDSFTYMGRTGSEVVYAPLAQHFDPSITVVARATTGDSSAVGSLQAAIRKADPDVAIVGVGDGSAMLRGPFALLQFASTSSLSLGLLTLGLAMVGLYGIQSLGVVLRTREIGLRMSFGATASRIQRMVLKDGYRPVFEGMAIGLFMGIAGRAIIRAYLDASISVLDPWMLAVVPIPLALAAFCACYLPSHRASRIDPLVALRDL